MVKEAPPTSLILYGHYPGGEYIHPVELNVQTR